MTKVFCLGSGSHDDYGIVLISLNLDTIIAEIKRRIEIVETQLKEFGKHDINYEMVEVQIEGRELDKLYDYNEESIDSGYEDKLHELKKQVEANNDKYWKNQRND